jgi:type VI protein secretion system component Hcp
MKRTFNSAVLLLTLVHASAALADDSGLAFVTIDGIQGESTRTGHEGQIEGSNFSQTFRLALVTGGGAGGGVGKPTLGPVVFEKPQGPASIKLLKALLSGQILPKVFIDFSAVGADGKSAVTYRITLLSVNVVGLNEKSVAGALVDEVQLSFVSGIWEVFDPADSTSFDGTTGKVNLLAPTGKRNVR